MGVDETGEHDRTGGVDHLVRVRLDPLRDGFDAVTDDQDVPAQLAKLVVHGQEVPAA